MSRLTIMATVVDVIDLRALTKAAAIDIGQKAGGIDFWKTTAPR